MDMYYISTVIDENCTKNGAKKGTQLMLRRVYYQQKSGGNVCEVRSVFFPFFKIGEIIEKLLSYILHLDFFVNTQIIYDSRQLFLSAREGTHYIVDIAEKAVSKRAKYLGLSYKLYSAEDTKRDHTTSTDIVPVLHSTPITLEDNDEFHVIAGRASYYVCDPSRGVAQENFQSELRVYPIGLYIPVAN